MKELSFGFDTSLAGFEASSEVARKFGGPSGCKQKPKLGHVFSKGLAALVAVFCLILLLILPLLLSCLHCARHD